jgi:tetratricopeptide (TPR) repeat protein
MIDSHLDRAQLLIGQSRYDLAVRELHAALAADPASSLAHALLALCLCRQRDLEAAGAEAHIAVALAPDWAFGHSVMTEVLYSRDRLEEAEHAVWEALRLNPFEPTHYAQLCDIHLRLGRWQKALETAEAGLAVNAEHAGCANARAAALTQLGRQTDAGLALAANLQRDPEDPAAHAIHGWHDLHQGEPERAVEHFRQALRLRPSFDNARDGLVHALRARYPVYGLILKYFLWMGRRSAVVYGLLVLGVFVLFRVMTSLAPPGDEWPLWAWLLIGGYSGATLVIWLAGPLFNLLLRLDRFGRQVLTRDETWAANVVGLLLVPTVAGLLLWLATGLAACGYFAGYCGFLLLPVAAIFHCEAGWPRRSMILFTLVLAALPVPFVIFGEGGSFAVQGFVWGCLLSSLLATFASLRRGQT